MSKATKRKGNKICAAGIAWAKRTFDTYPSAYANMAASKYCKVTVGSNMILPSHVSKGWFSFLIIIKGILANFF